MILASEDQTHIMIHFPFLMEPIADKEPKNGISFVQDILSSYFLNLEASVIVSFMNQDGNV